MDMYDILLARNLGSGGGSGTTNYNALENKPEINGVPLQGNKTTEDLGLGTAAEKDYTNTVEDGSPDLPTGDAVHDFVAAQVAYIDDSIEDVQGQIDTVRDIVNTELYGFKIDKQDSNPETRVTYMYDAIGKTPAHMDYENEVFDYGDWADAWFIRENKPCALRYNGTVAYYLNPNDYTLKEDGTASDVSDGSFEGNFMAQLPTIWVKRWEDENYIYTAISNRQIDSGFKAYAHDAGDGYVNDYIYLPMFKGSVVDSKLRSIAGVTPQGSTTGSNENTAAESCGAGWQLWDWSKHCLIADLLTLISRSTNSQATFGKGDVNTNDTTLPTYGMLTTGTSGAGQFWGANDETHHVKVFHIEDFWGNRSERCLGLVLEELSYKCKPVRPYSLSDYTGYTDTGIDAPAGTGFVKSMAVNEYGTFATDISGSNSTYFCDNVRIATGTKIPCFGGNCGDFNGRAGMFASHMNYGASYSVYYIGASPCYNAPHSGYDDKVDEDVFDYVQPQIDTIREILGVELYGFRIDKQDSNPATRVAYMYDAAGKAPAHMDYESGTFDYGDWANAWFIRENKPCALKYDGTVDYYLNPNDYTKKADGTASDVSDSSYAGNFMAAMPTVWVKRWEDSRYIYTAISNKQINDSYHAYAHDAGDGFINDFIYLPMFKGTIDTNGKMRSYAGHVPYNGTKYTAAQELTSIAQCGTGWQGWDLLKWRTLGDLCTLISKSTNSQAAFGGGDTNTFETTSGTGGMIPTGQDDLTTGQFNGYNDLVHHVKVFHVEDFWGNRTDRCYGIHTVNGEYVYKTHPPYSAEPDSTYTNSGIMVPEVGAVGAWIKSENIGDFGLLPSEVGGYATKYYCDYLWENHEGTRLGAIGGMDNHLYNVGTYFIMFNHDASLLNAWIGSSPLYNPPHSA